MFVINQYGHFFEIKTEGLSIRPEDLKGCTLYETERAMLEAVCEQNDLQMDEVEGGTLVVQFSPLVGCALCFEGRGMHEEIDGDVAKYVSEFVL